MLLLSVAFAYFTVVAQVPPPPPPPPADSAGRIRPVVRDPRGALPEATGTAIVRGRVVTADGRPVKHVIVSLAQAETADSGFDQMSDR